MNLKPTSIISCRVVVGRGEADEERVDEVGAEVGEGEDVSEAVEDTDGVVSSVGDGVPAEDGASAVGVGVLDFASVMAFREKRRTLGSKKGREASYDD